ncbi:hypothetical protein D3C80_1706180 [compost metagenome]
MSIINNCFLTKNNIYFLDHLLKKLILVLKDVIFFSGAKILLNALLIFFAASCILAYNYKKISLSKNQVRSASTKFLYENINYIVAFIAYGVVIYSLSLLAKISYAGNNIYEMLIVSAFIAILTLSKAYFFSPFGLRSLK